jgi:hypothetical protein
MAADVDVNLSGAVDRFYTQASVLAYGWFGASVLTVGVGLAVIVREVIQASGRPDLRARSKAATGLLVEAVAPLSYPRAGKTRKHASDSVTCTQGDRRAETARHVVNTIQDIERREEIAARPAPCCAGAGSVPLPLCRNAMAPALARRRSQPDGRDPDGAGDQ